MYSLNLLTWHDGDIQADEIWIKIGGDKGGSSLKMNFQIVNTQQPNSSQHTCIFAAVEAPDSITNLHVALDRYRPNESTRWGTVEVGKEECMHIHVQLYVIV